MEGLRKNCNICRVLFLLFIVLPQTILALQVNFYNRTCPNAENIVRQFVQQRFNADKTVTAALLRMHFHDCFVRGCDASILIDSTSNNQAEKAAGANGSVREFNLIDQIKAALERACPRTVSCADIITLATRDAVALSGGPRYNVPTGRLDGLVSRMSDVNLPGPTVSVSQAQQIFRAQGLSLTDMVALLGAHTVGIAHCNFFQDRISNFQGTGAPDSTMDPSLLNNLRRVCAASGNPSTGLDQSTPLAFDNSYYNQIRRNRGILQIDQELAIDPISSSAVATFASSSSRFTQSFVNAIIKMGNIQGSGGRIRTNCRRIN